MTINDFRFGGKVGRNTIMFVKRGSNTAYISNYGFWRRKSQRYGEDFIPRLVQTINHESLHKVLLHVKGETASKAIDKRWLFGKEPQDIVGIHIPVDDIAIPEVAERRAGATDSDDTAA